MDNNNNKQSSLNKLDNTLLIVVILMVIFIIATLGTSLFFQHINYDKGIELAENSNLVDHLAILSYVRAWDFAVIKTTTLLLGFILIFIGALYILRAVEVAYSLKANSSENIKLDFSTTSPGLVLSTLGVVIIIILLLNKSTISYQSSFQVVLSDVIE